jgi:hypothetical protein
MDDDLEARLRKVQQMIVGMTIAQSAMLHALGPAAAERAAKIMERISDQVLRSGITPVLQIAARFLRGAEALVPGDTGSD